MRRFGLWQDVKILLRTVPKVFRGSDVNDGVLPQEKEQAQ